MKAFSLKEDKVILITGASKGLGRELALRLSGDNTKLILVARPSGLLQELQTEIKNRTGITPDIIQCDVSKPGEVRNLAIFINEKYHRLDVLINNAGIAVHKTSELMGYEEMRNQFEVNFYGVFYCVQEMMKLLRNGQNGYILNIGSIADRGPFTDNSIYAATKSALRIYSRGLKLEMQKYGITVGILYPGLMNTGFQDDRKETEKTIPGFLITDTKKIASEIIRMIENRKTQSYMYRWMVWFLRIKYLIS